MWHWIAHALGLDGTGYPYGWWSGVGSDLAEFGILGVVWHRLNCHQKGCFRIGMHKVGDGTLVVCRRHHPAVPNEGATAEHIKAAHEAASSP